MSDNIEQPSIEQMSIKDGLLNIYRTSRGELAQASNLNRALLVTALVGLGFDWGSGNESLLTYVGANIHEATDNSIATGLGTGVASFAEQAVIGLSMVAAIDRFPRVAGAVRDLATRGQEVPEEQKRSKAGRFLGAFMFGAAVEVAAENTKRKRSISENVRHVIGSASLIAPGVVVVSAGMSSMVNAAEQVGLESQADTLVDVVSNPITYPIVFAGVIGFRKLKKFVKGRRNKAEDKSYVPLHMTATEVCSE